MTLAACQQGLPGPQPEIGDTASDYRPGSAFDDLAVGERALQSGDLAVAKRSFTTAMRRAPDDARAVLGLAKRM